MFQWNFLNSLNFVFIEENSNRPVASIVLFLVFEEWEPIYSKRKRWWNKRCQKTIKNMKEWVTNIEEIFRYLFPFNSLFTDIQNASSKSTNVIWEKSLLGKRYNGKNHTLKVTVSVP